MHHNIKKEKTELNILSNNLGSRNINFIKQNNNVLRPDTLEIQIKQDNMVNLISKSDMDNANTWNNDNLDNIILQIKNANNTPSPITPNSFFNPSDVTQDQEQFADALTLHLNKIKEEYKSSIETTECHYLSNVIQINSISQEKPIPLTTVSLGNKVYLLNQIGHNLDSNDNQCVNYSVVDIPSSLSLQHDKSTVHRPMQTSQYQSLRPNTPHQTILCSGQDLQFSSYTQRDGCEVPRLIPVSRHSNMFKTTEGVIYTRLAESSQSDVLSSLTSTVSHTNPSSVKRCLSPSSNDNDSSYGTNDSSVKTRPSDGNILPYKDDKDDAQRRLERKRARNRDAARKCRDRKNSLITTLEQKYARQSAEKDLIRDKLLRSLEEIRRLTEYISKHDPHSKFANFSTFLNEINIHELTEADQKDLNLL